MAASSLPTASKRIRCSHIYRWQIRSGRKDSLRASSAGLGDALSGYAAVPDSPTPLQLSSHLAHARCCGKTPMQTFLDSVSLAREKMLDRNFTSAPEPERSPAQGSAGGGAAAGTAA